MQWHGDAAPASPSPSPFHALLDARLHAHLNGSREAVDDLLLPLPHERHSARTSFSTTPLQQLSKGDTPPVPLSPAEATYCQLCELSPRLASPRLIIRGHPRGRKGGAPLADQTDEDDLPQPGASLFWEPIQLHRSTRAPHLGRAHTHTQSRLNP